MTTPPPAPPPHAAAPAVPPLDALALRHVMFFHRHGDRAPILTSVGSKWQMTREERAFWASRTATPAQLAALHRVAVVVGDDPSMPPHGVPRHRDMAPLAHLTAQGVDHMIAKGRALRAQYDAFVTAHALAEAPHDRVYVLSSNVDRTIQSVQCLLRGMFYPETDGPERPAFHVRTQAVNRLAPAHPITIFNEIERIVSHEVEKRDPAERAKMEQLGDVLREIVGVPSDQPVPWTAIRDGLTCRRANGLAFPEGITDDMYATMCEYDSWLWHQLFAQKPFCFNAYEHGVRQVYALLQSITDTEEAPEKKPLLSFFSAHDNSIVALVSALQLQVDRILPEYGTVVAFEVYEAPGSRQFYVRTLFEGKPVAFAGHEHSALCPFEHFDALAKQFLKGPDAAQETTN